MTEGRLTRADIAGMKAEAKAGDRASVLSDRQFGRILSAQKAGITTQDIQDVGDRLTTGTPNRGQVNRAMNAVAVQRRLTGMESTGWEHPRYSSKEMSQYLPTKHARQKSQAAAREYFRSVDLDPDALGV